MNIAFLPLRKNSKSIPNKNIKPFCGKPLFFWSLNELNKTAEIDKIVIATDSDEFREEINSFNFSKASVYMRDSINAQDESSTESVMLEYLEKDNSIDEKDRFILVQATNPFIRSNDFTNAIKLISKGNYDSLLTCARVKKFFWNEQGVSLNYDFKSRPRRQDFSGTLLENGAFYINTVVNIKKYKNRLSGKIAIYEMPEYSHIEIDEKDDWIIAENLMLRNILNKKTTLDHKKIKLFLSDVDGTLTDAGMYYGHDGEQQKKFNTHDGKGFELLRKANIKTGFITSEVSEIVLKRAEKLKIDFLFQGVSNNGKLDVAKEICKEQNISLEEVAYIGDDINCVELLEKVGAAACPKDAICQVKNIIGIKILSKKGGEGVVREFIDYLLK